MSLTIRTAEDIAADHLAAARASARLSRREFCLALSRAGILTPMDAVAAARGDWPASLAGFLDYLTDDEAADAQIEWAAAGHVERTAPLILILGSWLSLDDAAVDVMFGVT